MFSLKATIRDKKSKPEMLRRQGILPAVLYGAGIKTISLEVSEKDFIEIHKGAGESSMIKLEIGPGAQNLADQGLKIPKEAEVLIYDISKDYLTSRFIHVDFFLPSTKHKIEVEVPLVFEGESPACKILGGTLVKEIHEVKVKGLACDLIREIKVSIDSLETFEDRICVKDLKVPKEIEILKDPGEIVVHVTKLTMEEEIKPAAMEEKPPEESTEELKAGAKE